MTCFALEPDTETHNGGLALLSAGLLALADWRLGQVGAADVRAGLAVRQSRFRRIRIQILSTVGPTSLIATFAIVLTLGVSLLFSPGTQNLPA